MRADTQKKANKNGLFIENQTALCIQLQSRFGDHPTGDWIVGVQGHLSNTHEGVALWEFNQSTKRLGRRQI